MNPHVCLWSSRRRRKCRATCRGLSTCPYIKVAVVRKPTSWASCMTESHCSVLSLSGQIIARTSSSKTSAAVPGNVSSPASRNSNKNSLTVRPSVFAPCQTSNGEKAWMCISGTLALIALQMSRYVLPV